MSRTRTTSAVSNARDDRRFVTALARGLELLSCFRPQDRWLPHQELVRRTGLAHATVSRLTFTLVELGYLRHRPAAGEYALSPAVLALGFSMLSTFDIGRAARPIMQALADRAQAAVSLGVRHELSMIYVAHCRSSARLTLGLDVGTRLPIAVTAMGRAVLCAVSDAERERLSRALQANDPAQWPALRAGLARSAGLYSERGFVDSISDWEADIAAIGVPVEIGAGKEPFGLTIGGPTTHLHGPFLYDELGPALVQAARDITSAVCATNWRD
ncbi:MAG: IclR family transcriptional regulator [Variovorax sp.]|nr:MAG: IclR family transcriptional regulator [Variovorax sp.]